MKLAIMHPSVLARGLDDLGGLAARGIAGIQAAPELFVNEQGNLRQPRSRSAKAIQGAGLEVPAWCAYRSLIGPEEQVAAHIAAQKKIMALASRFRALVAEDSVPIVCTETGDPSAYPGRSPGSLWGQLQESVAELASYAALRDVCVAIEPTRSHIVDGSLAARKLVDHIASDHLGVCFDPANICGDKDHLGRAIDLLGDVIVLAHAKDVVFGPDGNVKDYPPAGKGQIDYPKFINLCSNLGKCGYIVLEYLPAAEAAEAAIAFVGGLLKRQERR